MEKIPDLDSLTVEELEKLRVRAYNERDDLVYYLTNEYLGYGEEDLEDPDSHKRGAAEFEASGLKKLLRKEEGIFESAKEEKYRNYSNFLEAVKKRGVNVNDIFADRKAKIELLEERGYTNLKGKNGSLIPLRDCSDARIGRALKNDAITAKRFIKQYER